MTCMWGYSRCAISCSRARAASSSLPVGKDSASQRSMNATRALSDEGCGFAESAAPPDALPLALPLPRARSLSSSSLLESAPLALLAGAELLESKEESEEDSEEDSEEREEESFHTAASESEDEDEDEDERDGSDEEENLTPSKRVNLKGTFDDVRDAEEEDEFEEADEFEDVEMEEEEEEDEEENDQDDSLVLVFVFYKSFYVIVVYHSLKLLTFLNVYNQDLNQLIYILL